jgi:hypothetical protein
MKMADGMKNTQLIGQRETAGDGVVDGLFAGAGAGLAMVAYLIAVALAGGGTPGTALGRFAPGTDADPLVGAVAHLAVSAVYGAFFGLLVSLAPASWRLDRLGTRRARMLGTAIGLVYGLMLVMLATTILLPRTGSALAELDTGHLVIAHAAYGLVLGWLMLGRNVAEM